MNRFPLCFTFIDGKCRQGGGCDRVDERKNRKYTWLWVIGWIVVFPIPLSLWLRDKNKIPMFIRLAIVTFAALFYVAFARAYVKVRKEQRDRDTVRVSNEAEPDTGREAGQEEEQNPVQSKAPEDGQSSGRETGQKTEQDAEQSETQEKTQGYTTKETEEKKTDAASDQEETRKTVDGDALRNLLQRASGFTPEELTNGTAYAGEPSVQVNGGEPLFCAEWEDSTGFGSAFSDAGEIQAGYVLSELDRLGRCGPAAAVLGPELMPKEERGQIGDIRPSGWHTVKYDFLEDLYLYNRCHLLGYQLTGLNAEERNLITGTRYLNVQGMEPYESQVADYVNRTGHHILYRVTPVYLGENLVADGVLMEALSLEDGGKGLKFAVYCFNVQPGVVIEYATGESWPANVNTADQNEQNVSVDAMETEDDPADPNEPESEKTYILNTNTHKFHRPTCGSVSDMKEKNKREYTGTRDEVISMGYVPCKRCDP